ncbi:hypothetical protein JX265_003717 [Neoarthrinium moseri]|uniref:Histone deacetylase domain-containing protein n=1 Tax=Neoarthrinium moseri TaxID=1658444 RepID=A0A9P9WSZ1_9PEZI|nr:hypothetical protein JX266_001101 [Neoarthrinium moseri]KAI1877709.1 hypothetical protein JX265_003717 [Neoarthrinium moseri]
MAAPDGSEGLRVKLEDDGEGPTLSSSSPSALPSIANAAADTDLLLSLNNLSLSTTSNSSPSPSRATSTSPHPAGPSLSTLERLTGGSSPSPQLRAKNPKSPASRSFSGLSSQAQSRSATPTLLKKSSTGSLRSVNGTTPSRRPSSTLFSPTLSRTPTNGSAQYNMEDLERSRPQRTEASVAADFFKAELEKNHGPTSAKAAATAVILQDACYAHRFERAHGTDEYGLSTIVERPERLQAVTIGAAAAYVRLGERHEGGKAPIHPDLDPSTLEVPFEIVKTDRQLPLNSPIVANVHGKKWMDELKIICAAAKSHLTQGTLEIKRPDIDRGPGAKPPDAFHEGDLFLSEASISAFEGALGATCEAVDRVFNDSATKRAFVAIRPPGHHCNADFPHGFCWLNNVHVGIMHSFMNHEATHAAIIDFDLHHGDGSQEITWDHNQRAQGIKNARTHPTPWNKAANWKKGSIGYFSLHDINSYPCENGDPDRIKDASVCIDDAHSQTIWNVHLEQWRDETEFWYLYRTKYTPLLEKVRAYLRREAQRWRQARRQPRAAIYLSAGFDASEHETPGMQRHTVNVPTEFYARLSRDVVKMAAEEDLGVDGRIISCLEGGYSNRALTSGVFSHLTGLAGNDIRFKEEIGSLGRRVSAGSPMNGSPMSRRNTVTSSDAEVRPRYAGFPYDPNWWTAAELDKLDAARAAPIPPPRVVREGPLPTYYSPTQASNAKVSDLAKARRSISGLSSLTSGPQPTFTRAPTPPPPAVSWATASQELARLLIPTNRQVNSITWNELHAEDIRIKKERQRERMTVSVDSAFAEPADNGPPGVRKSGRERKPVQNYAPPDESGKNRRRTVAGAAVLATDKVLPLQDIHVSIHDSNSVQQTTARGTAVSPSKKRQPSRRLSASSVLPTITTDPLPSPLPLADLGTDPESSQPSRPDSSLSIRTTTMLPVKKSRPLTARKDSTKAITASVKKASKTLSSPSKAKVKASNSASAQASARSSKASSPARPNSHDVGPGFISQEPPMTPDTATSDSGTGLDRITNGMRKIKINVVTKEMKEAREKERAGVKHGESSTTPVLEQFASEASSTPKIEESKLDQVQFSQPDHHLHSNEINNSPSEVGDVIYPLPQPVTPQKDNWQQQPAPITPAMNDQFPPVPKAPTTSAAGDSDLFVPYQPEGATPQAIPQSAPVTWLAPNTVDTPMPFQGHQFTATSTIPFAGTPLKGPKFKRKSPAVALPSSHERGPEPGATLPTEQRHDTADPDVSMEIPETPDGRL